MGPENFIFAPKFPQEPLKWGIFSITFCIFGQQFSDKFSHQLKFSRVAIALLAPCHARRRWLKLSINARCMMLGAF